MGCVCMTMMVYKHWDTVDMRGFRCVYIRGRMIEWEIETSFIGVMNCRFFGIY